MSPWWRSRMRTPTARTDELLVEELGEELLVYDQRNDQVHCLGSAARTVWRACDGKTSVEQLGRALNLDCELVDRALGELEACGLLDDEAAGGVTRREATGRLARIGAAAASAPLVYSIAAPAPASAASLRMCLAVGGCLRGPKAGGSGSGDNLPCTGSGSAGFKKCNAVGCACCSFTAPPSPLIVNCGIGTCVPDCKATGACTITTVRGPCGSVCGSKATGNNATERNCYD
jgi:hypothetical protein